MNLTQTITFHEIKPGDELPTINCHLALSDGGMTWGRWTPFNSPYLAQIMHGYWDTAKGSLHEAEVTHWAPPLKHPAQVEDAK